MSEICSEKDCRSLLEGERDEFGISPDMLEEGRTEKEGKFFFLHAVKGGLLYASNRNAIRVSNDQVPVLLIGSQSHV